MVCQPFPPISADKFFLNGMCNIPIFPVDYRTQQPIVAAAVEADQLSLLSAGQDADRQVSLLAEQVAG
jgi:hypothetical protein